MLADEKVSKPGLMWTREEFEAAVEGLKAQAKDIFTQDGHHIPIAFLFATIDPTDGEGRKLVIPIATDFSTEESKEIFSLFLKNAALKTKAVAVVFITEIWMVDQNTAPPGYDYSKVRPSECPDRIEALMVTSEHVRFGHQMSFAKISRDSENKPSLAEWETSPKFSKVSGRFVHLLPPVN